MTEARSFEIQAGAAEDVLEGIRVFNEGLSLLIALPIWYLEGKEKGFSLDRVDHQCPGCP